MMKNIKHIALSFLAIGFMACENDQIEDLRERANPTEDELPVLDTGSLNLSNYVSLGASFTAGFTDGSLFVAAQENSFPNIIANNFASANGATFTQPWMNDNFGGLAVGGNRILGPRLVFGGAGPVGLESIIGPVTVSTDIVLNNPTGPFNNLGVPGAKSFHLITPGYGNISNFPAAANPYAVRLTGNTPDATMLELALAQNQTFFTLSEMGGNDVLSYATSGGIGIDQMGNLDPSTYGSNDITDPNVFASVLSNVINALTANDASGLVTNVPFITDLPHFTTVPFNPIPLDAATASVVNQAYAQYNGGLQLAASNGLITADEVTNRTINFIASENNAVVIEDETLTNLGTLGLPSIRQATADDLFVLPAASFIGSEAQPGNPLSVNGVAVPLADQWVLLPSEQIAIRNATEAYNTTLATLTSSNPNVGLVDLNAVLAEAAATGLQFDDFNLNTDLVFGGLVSLDGIHLTARGYALMANKFLEAADTNFGSNFVASGNVAKAEDFPTNYSPLLQ